MLNFIHKLTLTAIAIALPIALVVFGGIAGLGVVVVTAVIIATN